MSQVIKVRRESNPGKVAGAIAKAIRHLGYPDALGVEVRAIGREAAFQAAVSIAFASDYLKGERPGFRLATTIKNEAITFGESEHAGVVYQLAWLPE